MRRFAWLFAGSLVGVAMVMLMMTPVLAQDGHARGNIKWFATSVNMEVQLAFEAREPGWGTLRFKRPDGKVLIVLDDVQVEGNLACVTGTVKQEQGNIPGVAVGTRFWAYIVDEGTPARNGDRISLYLSEQNCSPGKAASHEQMQGNAVVTE